MEKIHWKNELFLRPFKTSQSGALVHVFGKLLGLFLPHHVGVLESPLGLFGLLGLARMKKTGSRSLDP